MSAKQKRWFKVGDLVQSAPDSTDVTLMGDTWIAEIVRVVGDNDGGGCYETVGRWTSNLSARSTLRQLWGRHLVASER
jgi:hypothetical protein